MVREKEDYTSICRAWQADAEWSAKVLGLSWSQFLYEWNAQSVFNSHQIVDLPDRHLLQPRSHSIARAFNAWSLANQADLRDKTSLVPCPITLITGEEDQKYTKLAQEFTFPHQSHHIIRQSGHRTLWENTAESLLALQSTST